VVAKHYAYYGIAGNIRGIREIIILQTPQKLSDPEVLKENVGGGRVEAYRVLCERLQVL
jgi:hypothetical protein